jgi:HipA-like protein
MRRAIVYTRKKRAGFKQKLSNHHFEYDENYDGEAVSLCLQPEKNITYTFFPPFEGLLPEGSMLELLLYCEN